MRLKERFPTYWNPFAIRDFSILIIPITSKTARDPNNNKLDESMASAASSDPDDDHARTAVFLKQLLQRTREELDEDEEADARDDDEFLGRMRSRRTRPRRSFVMSATPQQRNCFTAEQSQSAQQQPEKESGGRIVRLDLEQRLQQLRSSAGTGTAGMAVVDTIDPSSKKRRKLVYPYPGGIYGAFCEIPALAGSDGFRQRTGFSREEFDAFYTEQGGDRGYLFKQPRNHYGEHSEEKNAKRRTIRGLLSDRDRILCWLEMLRNDVNFDEMSSKYGPSKATFHNDFKWMTMAARTMPFLLDVRRFSQRRCLCEAACFRAVGNSGHRTNFFRRIFQISNSDFYTEFNNGASVSLSFDYFSILTRVSNVSVFGLLVPGTNMSIFDSRKQYFELV